MCKGPERVYKRHVFGELKGPISVPMSRRVTFLGDLICVYLQHELSPI